MLSPAQLLVLKNDITTSGITGPLTSDFAASIADIYNANASPSFYVWKKEVTPDEYRSAIDWTEVKGMTPGDARVWEWITAGMSIAFNPSDTNIQAGLLAIFPTGSNTRTNLIAVSKRLATRAEKLFAVGTGSIGSPASLIFYGNIRFEQVQTARAM